MARIFLECRDDPPEGHKAGPHEPREVSYTFSVDVVFPGATAPCRFRGIEQVLALKKFYKLVFSLEERAREHGHPPQAPLESLDRLLEHLRYTRNARDVGGDSLRCRVSEIEHAACQRL